MNQSVKSSAATQQKQLPDGPCVFFWREGHWHTRADIGGRTTKLSPAQGTMLSKLQTMGALLEGPPGYFRLVAVAARPLANDLESPLARLAAMKLPSGAPLLDREQFTAGERLRQDYERAQLSPRTTSTYDNAGSSGGRHWQMSDNSLARLTDGTLAARERVHAAFDAIGPELSGILFQMCCLAAGLEQAERLLNLPRRAGKAILLMALTALARHYGLKPHVRHAGPSRIGHWAVDDYRPVLD